MEKYKCLIVEDEPIAAEVLKDYIQEIPSLSLVKICNDALTALEILKVEKIDLLFLDIHLPKLRGLDFIKTMVNPMQIIVTTAYREYAVESFELNVIDYLMKPISFNRFLMAVNKLKVHAEAPVSMPEAPKSNTIQRPHLYFNVNKKRVRVFIDDILFVESKKEYVEITTKITSFLTKLQLGEIEEMLTINDFIRIHRSFIVAKDKIDAFSATDIDVNGHSLPIGRSYKELVISILEKGL
jgi:DNA-binding LytR/AlgR family response regulator